MDEVLFSVLKELKELVKELSGLRRDLVQLRKQMNQRGTELANQVERLGDITAMNRR